jgi:hypothetical protein
MAHSAERKPPNGFISSIGCIGSIGLKGKEI